MARIQPRARIEKVVAVCALAIQTAPRTISTIPDTRNQAQDFLISSIPASNKPETVLISFLLSHVVSTPFIQCINTSGASLGTVSGVADLGSGLNFPKTEEFFRKCRSTAFTR